MESSRYRVHSEPAPSRARPVPKLTVERDSTCINCGICVRACIYEVHRRSDPDPRFMGESADERCRGCFRCVQECPRRALSIAVNPSYRLVGDGHLTPDIISTIGFQAEAGRIPVSGAGYRGRFSGPGFDRIWTDMSEIVRPTRDGIHGREYISAAIFLGRKPAYLRFGPEGLEGPPLLEIPIPMIFNASEELSQEPWKSVLIEAASRLETFVILPAEECLQDPPSCVIPSFTARSLHLHEGLVKEAPMVELEHGEGIERMIERVRAINPNAVICVRIPGQGRGERPFAPIAEELARSGVGAIHLVADRDGRIGRAHITEAIRSIHGRLLERSLRDEVTLLASGGIAHAEHVPKAMICGADGVALDLPLLIAMESWEEVKFDPQRGARRLVNLMGAWRDQLLEVLGAMGMREVRRLRGEVGRAMFFEDLEEEFAQIFQQEGGEGRHFKGDTAKFRIAVSRECIGCGLCAELCPYGVFNRPKGYNRLSTPASSRCIGFGCKEKPFHCVDRCPVGALKLDLDPSFKSLGDPRWTGDLLLSTYGQAETGRLPETDLEHEVGDSGGGFDVLRFRTSDGSKRQALKKEKPLTAIPLNRRGKGPKIWIPVPWYGGGMSFGSVSLSTMLARAKAAKAFKTFVSTGEGGYPEELVPYAEHIITQIATGLFGVREETIGRAPIVEFKYAQGAKPGLGGHLLADKVTAEVAKMRESGQFTSLFSPFPFHSVYSVEDHKKHLDWIRSVNPAALISVKVSTPTDVDMVAVGSYYAGANVIHLDGGYGGTGAAPDIAKKNIAMPIEYAIPKVHRFLVEEGIRDELVLIASGGVRTAYDIAKAIALGADGVVIGTAELVALGCTRCGNCERGRGCPLGIATTDSELSKLIDPEWGAQRIINLFHSWQAQLIEILGEMGMESVMELQGRTDCLEYLRQ